MFRLIDRYLLKEVILSWLAVTVVLALILVSNRLVRYLADAATGEIPSDVIFPLLGLKMVWYLVQVVPFALALGVVLGLGRLYRDSEMTILSACGIGPWRLYKPLLSLGLLVAIALAWLSLHAGPALQGVSHQLETLAKERADVTALGAGRFNEIQDGRLTFYAERLSKDKKNMENLFIVVREDTPGSDRLPQLLTAKTAYRKQDEQTGYDFLVLVDGYRYEGRPGTANYRIMRFTEYGIRVDLPDSIAIREKREATPTAELWQSSNLKDTAELQWRLALPVSVIVLVLLAVPLCKSSPRQGHYGRLVIALLLIVIYYNLLGTARVWVGDGVVPARIGLWWVPALPVLLTAILLGVERYPRLFRRCR